MSKRSCDDGVASPDNTFIGLRADHPETREEVEIWPQHAEARTTSRQQNSATPINTQHQQQHQRSDQRQRREIALHSKQQQRMKGLTERMAAYRSRVRCCRTRHTNPIDFMWSLAPQWTDMYAAQSNPKPAHFGRTVRFKSATTNGDAPDHWYFICALFIAAPRAACATIWICTGTSTCTRRSDATASSTGRSPRPRNARWARYSCVFDSELLCIELAC